MGSSDTLPSPHRARPKAPDFSELFRSGHASRHSSRVGAGHGSSPSSTPLPGERPTGAKAPSRRSMLPFLGRKKPAEQTPPVLAQSAPTTRKSVSSAAYQVTPVNTVRRSFGNGHAVLMITPSSNGSAVVPPLPSKLPSVDVHSPSLGSKLAAHFTPLRSPTRNTKSRHSVISKSSAPAPPLPPSPALSPPVPEVREPSIESQHPSMRSRSTTPRPLRGPHRSVVENGDEEDFSDLFTLPEHLRKPQPQPQPPKSPSSASVHLHLGDSPKKSGELTPTTPITPSGPPLQFPIPPSTVGPTRSILAEKGIPRYSSELASLSSQSSRSPSKLASAVALDSASTRTLHSDYSSVLEERRSRRQRTASVSGSDTDTSRAHDSTYSASSFKFTSMRPSSAKLRLSSSSATKTSSGPPPTLPLPSPPLSPSPASLGPRSAPNGSPNRTVFPRPRANTLSVTSNLVIPGPVLPKSNLSSPTRSSRANSNVAADATVDDLRDTLSQQCRKNAQLQEYIASITKRYEDDRVAMAKTIEKLERNIRKKTREIEGLRWLVIHNGAVSDIDAAANLARASFSTQDGDTFDVVRGATPLPSSPAVAPYHNGPQMLHQSTTSGLRGASITVTAAGASVHELRSDTSSSAASTSSVSETAAPSLSVIPERTDGISRAERQRLKEERRASKALRRISAASSFAVALDPSAESPLDPNFDPKQSMDEVMEKLQPFRNA